MKYINELILIDDDEDFLFLYKELLAEHDFFSAMISFTSFEEAYQYMLASPSSTNNVVITDLNLNHIKAWDFIEGIESDAPDLFDLYKFYVCSCSSYHEDIKRVKSSRRIVDFLDKPIDFEALKTSLGNTMPESLAS